MLVEGDRKLYGVLLGEDTYLCYCGDAYNSVVVVGLDTWLDSLESIFRPFFVDTKQSLRLIMVLFRDLLVFKLLGRD